MWNDCLGGEEGDLEDDCQVSGPLRLGTLGKDTWGDDLRSDVIVFPGKGAFDVESRKFSFCSSNSDRTPNSSSSIGETLESGTEIRISWPHVQAGWGENTGGSEGEVGWEMMLRPPASWLLVKCDVAQLHLKCASHASQMRVCIDRQYRPSC